MTTRGELRRALLRRLRLAGVCALALAGCKSPGKLFSRNPATPSGNLTSRGDPLLGGARIPPQDLPVPGKDGYSTRPKKDPLLGSPVGGGTEPDRGERAGKQGGKGSASGGPGREPFRPGPATTNAALAARMNPDDTVLSIGDRRTPGLATGGRAAEDGFEAVAAELKRYQATWGPPSREGGQYVFRCEVPTDPDHPGLVRGYEGAGATLTAAARQALEQVKTDHK